MGRERIAQFEEKPSNSFQKHWKAEKEKNRPKKASWFLPSDPNGTSEVLENSGFSGRTKCCTCSYHTHMQHC